MPEGPAGALCTAPAAPLVFSLSWTVSYPSMCCKRAPGPRRSEAPIGDADLIARHQPERCRSARHYRQPVPMSGIGNDGSTNSPSVTASPSLSKLNRKRISLRLHRSARTPGTPVLGRRRPNGRGRELEKPGRATSCRCSYRLRRTGCGAVILAGQPVGAQCAELTARRHRRFRAASP